MDMKRHVINNVMTTRYITFSAGTRKVMTTSVTTMYIFMEKNEDDKIAFKGSYDK